MIIEYKDFALNSQSHKNYHRWAQKYNGSTPQMSIEITIERDYKVLSLFSSLLLIMLLEYNNNLLMFEKKEHLKRVQTILCNQNCIN